MCALEEISRNTREIVVFLVDVLLSLAVSWFFLMWVAEKTPAKDRLAPDVPALKEIFTGVADKLFAIIVLFVFVCIAAIVVTAFIRLRKAKG
ncbi:MAG: hypothetical protein V1493_00670 [Candidatus Diapherotrites archaeon]